MGWIVLHETQFVSFDVFIFLTDIKSTQCQHLADLFHILTRTSRSSWTSWLKRQVIPFSYFSISDSKPKTINKSG